MKICFFVSSRADLGHLLPLIRECGKHDELIVSIVALELRTQNNGNDMGILLSDLQPFPVRFLKFESLDSDSEFFNVDLFSKLIWEASRSLAEEMPRILVVLGDRLETLSVALAAFLLRIDVGHLHGGEQSKGSLDDVFRKQISALASLHFPATTDSHERLVQMGFDPASIYRHGALAVDAVDEIVKVTDVSFLEELKLKPYEYVVCTYHPATCFADNGLAEIKELLKILDQYTFPVVFTRVNTEMGGVQIEREIEKFVQKNPHKRKYLGNLGSFRYIKLIQNCKFLLGNSSSGIFEAPILGIPSAIFGKRQEARWRPKSVKQINNSEDFKSFFDSLPEVPRLIPSLDYGAPGVAGRVLRSIIEHNE